MAECHIQVLVASFGRLDTDGQRRRFILDHPVMISNAFVQAILETPETGLPFLQTIDVVGGKVSMADGTLTVGFNADRYPVDDGPIEKLWRQIETKQISLAFAIEKARRPEFSNNLTFVYIKALCDSCRELQETNQSLAHNRQRVVVDAAEALAVASTSLSSDEVWQIRCASALTFIEAAGAYLVGVADARALIHATTIGDRLIKEGKFRKDQNYLPHLLQRMGVLYLDPYTASRDLSNEHNYRFDICSWQNRLFDVLGPEYPSLTEAERMMPEPEAALGKSERYLRDAVQLQTGHEKALSLTALVQGLLTQLQLGKALDKTEIVARINESLPELAPGKDDERIIRLMNWRDGLLRDLQQDTAKDRPSISADRVNEHDGLHIRDITDQINRFLNSPIDSITPDLGYAGTLDAVNQLSIFLLRLEENATGLRIIDRFRSLFERPSVPEHVRARLWQREIRLLRGWYAGRHGSFEPQAYTRLVRIGSMQIGGTGASKFRVSEIDKHVAELLSKALNSGVGDQEEKGLEAIDKAAELDASLFASNYDALTYHQALLTLGAGANAFNRRDLNRAVSHYISALAFNLILNQKMNVYRCLEYLENVVTLGDHAATFRLVRALGHLADDIEVIAGTSGAERLQSIYRQASSLWLTQSGELATDTDTVFLIFRLAKGCRFSRCMRSKMRYDWRDDPEALHQLDTIRKAKSALGLTSQDMPARDFRDPELFLIGHSGIHELLAGASAEEQFENLRLAFDDYLSRATAAKGIGSLKDRWSQLDPWGQLDLVTIEDIQSVIDDRSVLIDYYVGQDRARKPMLYVLCLTNVEVTLSGISVSDLDSEEVLRNEAGARAELPPIAQMVLDTRAGANSTPGFSRVVSRHGDLALQAAWQVLISAIEDFLRTSRIKGRTHLCIVPHQALHFMPFHLLGPVNAPAGTEWIITYLPTIELLIGRPSGTGVKARNATAVGLDFQQQTQFSLPPLKCAPASAREVADLLCGQALINLDATEPNVMAALPESRYFHLFTHGQQCVYAPAFHALYLAPDAKEGKDGVLEAYELLPLDLREIEVMTLSACETALGRFDVGDNLMGLPGCLLFAGVETIIGTLWPVSAPVAELFFKSFYTDIRNEKSKLTAFEFAQQVTRAAFPEYRDWGAFYFVGRW